MTYVDPTRFQLMEVEYLIAVTALEPGKCDACDELNRAMAAFGSTPAIRTFSDGVRLSLYDVGRRHLLAEHNYAHKIKEASR